MTLRLGDVCSQGHAIDEKDKLDEHGRCRSCVIEMKAERSAILDRSTRHAPAKGDRG